MKKKIINPWRYSSEDPRPTEVVADGSRGAFVVSKALSLNLNFSFLNLISLLFGLTRLGGLRSRPYTSRNISWI